MENQIEASRTLRNRTYYTGPIRERDKKLHGLTLRSFFGDDFQFFVNVEYDFKDEQVRISLRCHQCFPNIPFNLDIQWIWADSGKQVENSIWQKSGKWKNHPEDQGLESELQISQKQRYNG